MYFMETQQLIEAIKKDPLNPENWKALGRAKGWTDDTTKEKWNHLTTGTWQYLHWNTHALHFFELKLTGGDETAFWEELLK